MVGVADHLAKRVVNKDINQQTRKEISTEDKTDISMQANKEVHQRLLPTASPQLRQVHLRAPYQATRSLAAGYVFVLKVFL